MAIPKEYTLDDLLLRHHWDDEGHQFMFKNSRGNIRWFPSNSDYLRGPIDPLLLANVRIWLEQLNGAQLYPLIESDLLANMNLERKQFESGQFRYMAYRNSQTHKGRIEQLIMRGVVRPSDEEWWDLKTEDYSVLETFLRRTNSFNLFGDISNWFIEVDGRSRADLSLERQPFNLRKFTVAEFQGLRQFSWKKALQILGNVETWKTFLLVAAVMAHVTALGLLIWHPMLFSEDVRVQGLLRDLALFNILPIGICIFTLAEPRKFDRDAVIFMLAVLWGCLAWNGWIHHTTVWIWYIEALGAVVSVTLFCLKQITGKTHS